MTTTTKWRLSVYSTPALAVSLVASVGLQIAGVRSGWPGTDALAVAPMVPVLAGTARDAVARRVAARRRGAQADMEGEGTR